MTTTDSRKSELHSSTLRFLVTGTRLARNAGYRAETTAALGSKARYPNGLILFSLAVQICGTSICAEQIAAVAITSLSRN